VNKAYLLLGSNREPRFDFIMKAVHLIENGPGKVCDKSSIYESEPWGFRADTLFLNSVVLIETERTAMDLLNEVLQIEKSLGRTRRGSGYASRNIDIDILYFNDEIMELPGLIIPHPRLHERRFTLEPLVEVAPEFIHPLLGKTNSELLAQVSDSTEVRIFKTAKEL